MADYLTTSGIATLVSNYSDNEIKKKITPLTDKVQTYQSKSSVWTDLNSRLNALKLVAADLRSSTSDTYFAAKSTTSSNSAFVTATATKDASTAAFNMRVSQLAKNDIAVSNNMTSATAVTTMAGTHSLQFTSGDYHGSVDVALTGTETNQTVMQKMSDAINQSKAVINTGSMDGSATYSGAGAFTLNLNGTENSIAYDFTGGKTYSEVIDAMATKINNQVSGILAEKIVDGNNVSLRISVSSTSQYITMSKSSDTGTLLNASNLNTDVTNLKAAGGLVSTAVFSPSSGNSKISFTSVVSGYDNRLQMTEASGSALSFVGLNSGLLSARTKNPDDSGAGFIYNVTSSTDNQLNAKLIFNGINIQSNTNTLDKLANGITFNLNSIMASTDSDVAVNVQTDVASVKTKVKDFLNKYNSTYTSIKSRSMTDLSGRGLFVGDPTAVGLLKSLTSLGMGKINGLPQGNLSYLSQVGIIFDPLTGLTISDDTKLTNAITNKPTQLSAMFNSTNGIATQLYSTVSNYTGADGSIARIQTSLNSNIKYMNDKVTSTQKSIEKNATVLRDQYNRLQQQLVGLLNAQQAFSAFGA